MPDIPLRAGIGEEALRAFLPAGVEGAVGMQGGLGGGDGQVPEVCVVWFKIRCVHQLTDVDCGGWTRPQNRDVIEIRDPVKGTTHVYYRFRGGEGEGDLPYCAKGMEKLRYGEVIRIESDEDGEDGEEKRGDGEEADDSKDGDEDDATEFVDHVSSGVNDILIVGEVRRLYPHHTPCSIAFRICLTHVVLTL